MKINSIDIDATLTKAKKLLQEEKDLSPAFQSTMEVLLMLVSLLLNRTYSIALTVASHRPLTSTAKRKPSNKPAGGQKGHVGKTLRKISDPDEIKVIKVDRRRLPKGSYTEAGFETRQVFDIDISRLVTEYQAQVLKNDQGKCFVASFSEGVSKAVQYGNQLKAHAVYLSQYQLLPYKRIQEYFSDQLHMPLSEGSLYNFNLQAYMKLADFEQMSKDPKSPDRTPIFLKTRKK